MKPNFEKGGRFYRWKNSSPCGETTVPFFFATSSWNTSLGSTWKTMSMTTPTLQLPTGLLAILFAGQTYVFIPHSALLAPNPMSKDSPEGEDGRLSATRLACNLSYIF